MSQGSFGLDTTVEDFKARRAKLHRTLEKALYVMGMETGCTNKRAEALLARWDEINEDYDQFCNDLLTEARKRLRGKDG